MLNINVVRCYTFDTKCLMSVKDKQINKDCIIKLTKEDKDLIKNYHFPLGYEIQNIDTKPIENIQIPEYNKNNDIYVGTIKTITLQPNDFLILPTKYLMLLLFQQSKDLKINNGQFIPIIKGVDFKNDSDALLTNYRFRANELWQELTNLDNNPFFYRPMSYVEVINEKANDVSDAIEDKKYYIVEDDLLKLFGNYMNPLYKVITIKNNSKNNSINFINYLMKR